MSVCTCMKYILHNPPIKRLVARRRRRYLHRGVAKRHTGEHEPARKRRRSTLGCVSTGRTHTRSGASHCQHTAPSFPFLHPQCRHSVLPFYPTFLVPFAAKVARSGRPIDVARRFSRQNALIFGACFLFLSSVSTPYMCAPTTTPPARSCGIRWAGGLH